MEKWVHLGGVLSGEEGDAFVAIGGLRGTTPLQHRRPSLGKELRETIARVSCLQFSLVVSFPSPFLSIICSTCGYFTYSYCTFLVNLVIASYRFYL
jgi:hypothetical protein